jgi:Carboxypeptidase regulatory-like domain
MRNTRSNWRRHVATTCFSGLLLMLAPAAFSQTMTTGDIVGTVTDASGAVVPKATVTERFVDENSMQTQTTNEKGEYRFSLMKPGDYTIEASATGLKSKIQKINLLVGQVATVNLGLQVQGTSETVEVRAETAILQTENANLSTGVSTAQVVNLPMSGGDLTTVMFTVPGVLVGGGCGQGNACVNGIPTASVLYTLNGADDMDPYLNINNSGASNNTLGSNEVAEAAVVLNAYSADYGRMAGAQVNWVGKSGTNSFHGNLYHNYNDKIFNANDFFNNQAGIQEPRSDAHQFGGQIGGPIRKNKLFFLVNYESLRYALPDSGVVKIPSPQMQTYTLAHIPAAALPLYQDAFNLWNNAPGAQNAVPETNGNGPLQDGLGHLGCGNGTFYGGGGHTPIAAPGGGQFGINVPCTYAFGADASEQNSESLFTARVDYNLSDKNKLSFRYNYDWGLQATGPSFITPVLNELSHQPADSGQLTYTAVITPTLVNNFIGSGSWYQAQFGYSNLSKALSVMPDSFNVSDAGWASLGVATNFPQGRDVGQAQFVDDLTWTHGRHTFKGGFNYRYNKVTDFTNNEGAFLGRYTFADLTDFTTSQINATGLGDSFSQSFPNLYQVHLRLNSLGAYVQDEWRVRNNLTLTLGFRIEHDGNPSCVDNCFARLNQQFGTAGYSGGASIPYNQTISTGLHNLYQGLETVIPEPRFGFAWSPFGQGKTVIRGGIGLFANLFAASVASSVFRNAPSVFTPTVTFGEAGPATDPASSAYAAAAAANVFRGGFSAGDTLSQLQAALGKIPFSAPNYYSAPNNFVAPKVTEWSLSIEHPVTQHNVVALTYNGNHGYDNSLSNGFANAFLLLSNGTNKYYGTSFAGLPTAAPDPRFLTVTQILTQGYSNYDGLTVQLRHAFSHGLQGQIGYTWSHALGLTTVYNPYNLGFGYGNLPIDRRNAISSDLIWQEPKLGNKYLNFVGGGWTFGAKMYIYSGTPFSSSDSKINAQINSGGGFSGTFLATVIDPNIATNCSAVHGSSAAPCFTTSQFETYNSTSGVSTPIQTNFGQTGPGVFRGPGFFNLDTNVTKKFFIHEKMNIELGAQFYNALNHPNFSNPTASITSGTLGYTSGDIAPPTSIYGSGQGALVTGRVIVITGKFSF